MAVIVIKSEETHRLERDTNKLIREMKVTWRADDRHGPYTTLFPLEGFSAVMARLKLDELAREYTAIGG